MPSTRVFSRSFAGGIIGPELFGRIDDAKFQTGAAVLKNFISTPQGPAENRPGFVFVKEVKNYTVARLIPFTFNTTQTMVIEMGQNYFRFHTQGETLLPPDIATLPAYVPSHFVTISIAAPAVVTWTAHGLVGDQQVYFGTSGALPAPLAIETPYAVSVIDANSLHLHNIADGSLVNTSGTQSGTHSGFFNYQVGDLVSYGGNIYYAQRALVGYSTPGVDVDSWVLVPLDAYEIPSPYAAADLFSIHYVQSHDVMTLVHPLYPPMELRREGATQWILTEIQFAPSIAPPGNVAVTASPGFKTSVTAVTNPSSDALITTAANHTLAMGDQIYIDKLNGIVGGVVTDFSGFFIVSSIPVDTSGNLILNELHVMDYNGVPLNTSTWTSWHPPTTIQLANKAFDPYSHYAVTSIAANGVEESVLSPTVSALNNLNVAGSYNTITWTAAAGALRYYVYKQRNGLFGYIGETTALVFVDDNIAPDFSITPPNYESIFNSDGNYPGAVSYYEQRRTFAGTINQPENLWMSNSGTESTFSYSLPTKATDRVAIRVAAREANTIRHIVPLTRLLLMTSACEWAVIPVGADAITPTSIAVQPQSYVGTAQPQPNVVNNLMVFCANRGGHVRELGYKWEANSFVTGDLSLRATHLFDNMTLVDQTYGKAPRPILWFVSSGGDLLGLTYVPEEQVGSWHQHDTDGSFESVCSIAEGNEDFLYAVIRRQLASGTVRYIERMASRLFPSREKCVFMDSAQTYDGTSTDGTTLTIDPIPTGLPLPLPPSYTLTITASTTPSFFPADIGDVLVLTLDNGSIWRVTVSAWVSPTVVNAIVNWDAAFALGGQVIDTWAWARNTFSGLGHLEGKTVTILADGAVVPNQVVTGGKVTLVHPSTIVTVGLPYTCDLETLPLILQIDGYGQGRSKNINKAWVRVWMSSGIFIGPDEDHLTEAKQRTSEPYGSPPALQTDEIMVMTSPSWQQSGQILIRQVYPLPLTVVGLTLEVAIGG